jgi:hypothetical protein
MWNKLLVGLSLLAVPSVAVADNKAKDAAKKQALADKARESAAKQAAKGNSAASKNMAKLAEQRQKTADHAAKKK